MQEMFIHVTPMSVVCTWYDPLRGWPRSEFRFTNYSHPEVHFMQCSKGYGRMQSSSTVDYIVMLALQDAGIGVLALEIARFPSKKKKKKPNPERKRLF